MVSLSLARVHTSALAPVFLSRRFLCLSLSFCVPNNMGADLNARTKFTAVSTGLSYMRRVSFTFAQDVLYTLRGGERGGTQDQSQAKIKAFYFLLIPIRGWVGVNRAAKGLPRHWCSKNGYCRADKSLLYVCGSHLYITLRDARQKC